MTVSLSGHILVPKDQLAIVRAALPEHCRLTLAEAGCLRFEVVESSTQPGRFDVSEEFTDAAAFEAHQVRAKSSPWGNVTAGMTRTYEITGL